MVLTPALWSTCFLHHQLKTCWDVTSQETGCFSMFASRAAFQLSGIKPLSGTYVALANSALDEWTCDTIQVMYYYAGIRKNIVFHSTSGNSSKATQKLDTNSIFNQKRTELKTDITSMFTQSPFPLLHTLSNVFYSLRHGCLTSVCKVWRS